MSYLLDTCVLSEFVSPQPEPNVLKWLDAVDETLTYLSVLTLGEIRRGVDRLPDSQRKERLADWLDTDLTDRFQGRVLVIDHGVALAWGALLARMEAQGRPLPAVDSLIAATALCHDLTLVTRNEKEFADTDLPLFNPWTMPEAGAP